MKHFQEFAFSKHQARAELKEFRKLLDDPSKSELGEKEDLLPFFASHRHLIALMGAYAPFAERMDRIAWELDLFGDHIADLVSGDSKGGNYCFVEIEDAKETSIFKKTKKATAEYSDRFNRGYSQIIDWIMWLEEQKGQTPYKDRFHTDEIHYAGLLVIGRDKFLTPSQQYRLKWRSRNMMVCGRSIFCITFDGLYEHLNSKLMLFENYS